MSNPTGKGGFQERKHQINRKGKPKDFTAFRTLALQIGSEQATKPDGSPLLWNGKPITWAEYALRTWLTDKRLIEKFVEAAFGKVPIPVQHTGADGGAITLRVVRDMESGSRIPDPSTKPAP